MADGDVMADASQARDVIVRPCPKLFPSFTATWPELDVFCKIYAKVMNDTYLSHGYRKQGSAKPFRGIVADTRHYAVGNAGRKDSVCTPGKHRVMRRNTKTGETEIYDSIAEAAKFNARSAATLRRQIAEGFSPRYKYVFEILNDDENQ